MNQTIRDIISRRNFVILDTETTGLRRPAEIIEVAVIDPAETIVFNTLLNPRGEVPQEASNVHGLYKADLADCPSWPIIKPLLIEAIRGKDVLVYNAKYDRHMMHCSDDMWGLEKTDYHAVATWTCVMEAYADFWGEWDVYHASNKWQRLTVACQQQGVELIEAHHALSDCLMTLRLLKKLAGDLDAWKWYTFQGKS